MSEKTKNENGEEGEGDSLLITKLKKSLRLNNKLQEKITFERRVSHELARRNAQLKKDFANETHKYKTLVLAFEDLFLEYKELLDVHGTSLANGLPPPGSENLQKMTTAHENRLAFLNSIRSKAGIERHVASEDILNLTSGSSLLRKSSEAIILKQPNSPVSQSDGLKPRSNSFRQPTSNSRRQSFISLPSDIELTEEIEESALPSESLLTGQKSAISIVDLECHNPDVPNVEDSSFCSDEHRQQHSNSHSDNIPLFEHFLVIGASVDTSIDISNELIDKQTRLMRGKLRNTFDMLFGRGNSPARNNKSDEITSATLSRQSSVKRGTSHESDFVSDTASISSEKTNTWRGGMFTKRSSSTKQLGSENGEVESTVSTTERNSDGIANPPQPRTGWSSRLARMMHTRKEVPQQDASTQPVVQSISEDSEVHQHTSAIRPRRESVNNSTWTANFLSKIGVSTSVTNEDVIDSSSGDDEIVDDMDGSTHETTALTSGSDSLNIRSATPPQSSSIGQKSYDTTSSSPSTMMRASPVTPSTPATSSGSKLPTEETVTLADPEILYRFPEDADAPPSQICGFCLPNGARIRHLIGEDEENKIIEILYGENHDTRSGRCFIFILEDKTIDIKRNKPNDEEGISTGRTYGICVIHPRWINTAAEDKAGRLLNPDGTTKPSLQFEVETCYCFISRFPLFDFFFKMIWSIISYERIVRMENITTLANDRTAYEYLPVEVYNRVLERLTAIPPPKYNESLHFQISSLVAPIEYERLEPLPNTPEHIANATAWALPPLLHYLSSHLIIWALGLLMCEVKLIVVGTEPALVSCTVIGLISLLKPLVWPNPVVPFIPSQFMEFLQSIPPIVGGILRSPHSKEDTTPLGILQYIGDYDNISAVLDLTTRDIYVLSKHAITVRELMLPGGKSVVSAIEHIKQNDEMSDQSSDKPIYTHAPEQNKTIQLIQRGIRIHLKSIADNAKNVAGEVIFERMNAVERKNKLILKRINKIRSSFSCPDNSESFVEDDLNSNENGDEGVNDNGENKYDDDDETILNGELLLESLSGSLSPFNESNEMKESSPFPSDGLSRRFSDPPPIASSSGTVGGDVESVISIKDIPFSSNSDSQHEYQKFLRRFISTQMFSEYDKDIVGILRNVETVRLVQNDSTSFE